MGLLRSLAGRSSGVATPEKWLVEWFKGGLTTSAGLHVDHESALTSTAFFGGVRILAEDVAALPLHTYERQGDRGKRRATDHPLYSLLHDAPNPLMSAIQFRESLQGHVETWGTGYASIERRGGRVVGLWPLRPDRIIPEVKRDNLNRIRVVWRYDDPHNNIHARLTPDDLLRIPGFGYDGIRGYSLVELHRDAIGLSLAMERFGASHFRNGSRPGGVLQSPDQVSDDARKRMKSDWEQLHRGLDNAQRVAILEEGVQWQQVGMSNEDSQFLEGRTFQVNEMARMLRLPPHKLAELSRATFSNIEDQGRDYVTSSMRPRLVRWEQAIHQQLLTEDERRRFFAEHLVDALLRGDTKSRYEAYAVGRQWGWLNGDDIREKENMDPIDDGSGQTYLVPLNTAPAPKPGESMGDDGRASGSRQHRSPESRRRIAGRFTDMIADLDERLAKMEKAEVESLVRRHLEQRSTSAFRAELEELYQTLGERQRERWLPLFDAMSRDVAADTAEEIDFDGDVEEGISEFAAAYTTSHVAHRVAVAVGELGELVESADDPARAVGARLDEWVADRPGQTARQHRVQLAEATARKVYEKGGVRKLRWMTVGENCPFCSTMSGRIVGIEQPFMDAGETLDGGSKGQLQSARRVFNPPVHVGCDCQVVPA